MPADTYIVNRLAYTEGLNLTSMPANTYMAGVGGFEPPHDEIKTRCLTAWLYPMKMKSEMVAIAGLEPATLAL